jgi:hypothetical protein
LENNQVQKCSLEKKSVYSKTTPVNLETNSGWTQQLGTRGFKISPPQLDSKSKEEDCQEKLKSYPHPRAELRAALSFVKRDKVTMDEDETKL